MPKGLNSAGRSKFYSRIGAQGWRNTGYDTFGYYSPFFRRWLGSQLPAASQEILSVGCGSGETEQHLTVLSHRVVGLDLSFPMLARASRKGLDRVVQADACRLPFRAAHFDLVTMFESIGYLTLDDAFAESRRVLKPRGRLLITSYAAPIDAHARYRKWRMDEITRKLVGAGFDIDEQLYLDIKKKTVRDVPSEDEAGLLYISSTARARE